MPDDDVQADEVVAWFESRGFTLVVEERDMRAEYRRMGHGANPVARYTHWADLVSVRTGEVVSAGYGAGPTRVLAIVDAEQRWLVEQGDDRSAAPGTTYIEKAQERLRRGRER